MRHLAILLPAILISCLSPKSTDDDEDGGTSGEDCATAGDEDGDGVEGCCDTECGEETACAPGTGTEEGSSACADCVDNDGDSFIDVDDFDCDGATGGGTADSETDCDDGIDNDGDGYTDMDDWDCEDGGTGGGTADSEIDCGDGIDNDGDGFTDCDDYSCQYNYDIDDCEHPEGGEAEASDATCGDGDDNDGDGFTDCKDFGCVFTTSVTICGD